MDVYSPSHPTDQDGDCDGNSLNFIEIAINEHEDNKSTQDSKRITSESGYFPLAKDYCQLKSPDLSPSLSSSSDNPDISNVQKEFTENANTLSNSIQSDKPIEENGNCVPKEETSAKVMAITEEKATKKEDHKRSSSRDRKFDKERSRKEHSPCHKELNRDSASKFFRHRSRSLKRKRGSRSPGRGSQKRSSSRSRYSRSSRTRRQSRSRSRDSRKRYSRSPSRCRYERRRRDFQYKDHRSRSRSHQNKDHGVEDPNQSDQKGSFISNMTELIVPRPSQSSDAPLQDIASKNDPSSDRHCDMDETSTPDISEDQNVSISTVNENAAFVFQQSQAPPPPPVSANFMNWPNRFNNILPQFHQGSFQSIPTIQNAFPSHQVATSRFNNNFSQQLRTIVPPPRDLAPNLPPCSNLMTQRPSASFNPSTSGVPRCSPSAQLMGFSGMLNPLFNPFALLTTQPPPPPPPPPFNSASAKSTPGPRQQFIHHLGGVNPMVTPFQPTSLEIRLRNSPPPPPPPTSQPNLLETLMTKAGLSADGLHSNDPNFSMSNIPLPASNAPTVENKSPMKKISKLLNSAASNLLNASRDVNQCSSSPPPPPPPPLPVLSGFPPLPPISEVSNGNANVPSTSDERKRHHHGHRPEHIQQMLTKKRRSEFGSSREWQERIALEVKGFIKPYYSSGKVSKEDCRTVLKRSVNKIFKSKCTSIDTRKIGEFVKLYLKKYQKYRKWQARQQEKMRLESQAANKEPTVQ